MGIRTPRTKRVGLHVAGSTLLFVSACVGSIETPSGSTRNLDGDTAPTLGPNGTVVPGLPGTASGPNATNPSGAAAPAGSPGAPGASGTDVVAGFTADLRCDTPAVGPSPLRRLTHTEYNN